MVKNPIKSIFEFTDYREYLLSRFSVTGATRGRRSQWAKQLQVKPPFITLVMQKKIDLSPEHIPPTNEFLGHSKDEGHFFTILVLRERAATLKLKQYYDEQIIDFLDQRKKRLENKHEMNVLSPIHQSVYFSKWYYSAIRLLVSISKYQTRPALSERLNLPLSTITDAVETLMKLGLIHEKNGKLNLLEKNITLKHDSPYRALMHLNMRNRAIHSLSSPEPRDYHTTYGMAMNMKSFEKLRKAIVDTLKENDEMIENSPEEEAFALTIDLFKLV